MAHSRSGRQQPQGGDLPGLPTASSAASGPIALSWPATGTMTWPAFVTGGIAAGFTRMLTPLGNYLIARPAARAAAGKITEETGVPLDAAVVLGLSPDALQVWRADPMLDQVSAAAG